MADEEPSRLEAIVNWHRYLLAGAALAEPRLREILAMVYRFRTSRGPLLFDELLQKSVADGLHESNAEFVIWYNADRRQERYLDDVFASNPVLACMYFAALKKTCWLR